MNPKGPLQLAEAENAVEIARLAGADRYAADTMQKAQVDLKNAEDFLSHGRNRKESETNAREATQMAEDARIITIRKIHDDELAAERAASASREAAEKAKAEASAREAQLELQRREQAEAEQRAADQAKQEALQAKAQAEQATQVASRERAEADAARAAALQQQQAAEAEAERARQAAQLSEQQRQQAESEKTALRQRLLQQLNLILETRESQRGLIVNINDVLFDFNKYTLKPGAREKLARYLASCWHTRG